jgi:putative Mn2+ efflux pump MntP
MVALLVVAVALGLNNFGAAIAIGVSGVDRRTEIKVATVFGLCDVVMPAAGLALGTVRYSIVLAVALFGLMSFVMSIIGLKLGAKLGTATGEHGKVVGAVMLLGLSGVMAAGWL